MARVVMKTQTKGVIDLKSMSQKNEIMVDERTLAIQLDTAPSELLTGTGAATGKRWPKDWPKPVAVEDIYRQIRELFNIGTEVDGYTAFYFPPPEKVGRGYDSKALILSGAEFGCAARMILVVGTREMLVMDVSAVGKSGTKREMIGRNWCMSLPIGFCSQCVLTFNNVTKEPLPHRDGFRDGATMTKDPSKRQVLIFDLHTSAKVVSERIQKEIASSKEPAKPDVDAAIAAVERANRRAQITAAVEAARKSQAVLEEVAPVPVEETPKVEDKPLEDEEGDDDNICESGFCVSAVPT